MSFEAAIQGRIGEVVELRHRLHRIPELAYEEVKTAAAIRGELDRMGIEHTDGVEGAGTATIGVIGDVNKPCVALRADIDGLPILEKTGLKYASEHAGRMHACGHDGHIAMLLGTAGVLNEVRDRLGVCVKLIFQPAEEDGGGAERIVKAGGLDGKVGPKVSAIFGLHGWPSLPVGTVATKAGAIMAATDVFKVIIRGKGCHGAFPHLGADPIVAAAEAILDLQQIVSRELDPTEPGVVTVGKVGAGTATNVIPDEAVFEGTARTVSTAARGAIKSAIHRRVSAVASASKCSAEIQWTEGYPATVNDPGMTDYVAKVAREALGAEKFLMAGRPSMGGEDFAYYLEKVPGCFFYIGVQPVAGKGYPSLHNDHFDFTDGAIGVGMRMMVELALKFRA